MRELYVKAVVRHMLDHKLVYGNGVITNINAIKYFVSLCFKINKGRDSMANMPIVLKNYA